MTHAVYLDNAATTPVRPDVLEAMHPFLTDDVFGNPSSPHRFGRAARQALEHARRQVAVAVGVDSGQVYFTSGGTEADNLAVLGAALATRARGGPFRVAVTAVEHKAVLAAAKVVESLGGESLVLPVQSDGAVSQAAVDQALQRGVAVLSVMWVNNEVGVTQDVSDLARRAHAAGVLFHTDAVQAVGKVPCNIADLPCDMLTLSAHKVGGPKGAGALIVRDRNAVQPLLHGGGQQFGVRPGTENVPGIVGLGAAVELAVREQPSTSRQLAGLRDGFEERLRAAVPDAVVVGEHAPRAPHITNVAIPGTDSEAMLMHLDLAGIACSSGSACTTGAIEPSHVLTAMGVPHELAVAALRFSFFKQNTQADVDLALEALPRVVHEVRKLAAVLGR